MENVMYESFNKKLKVGRKIKVSYYNEVGNFEFISKIESFREIDHFKEDFYLSLENGSYFRFPEYLEEIEGGESWVSFVHSGENGDLSLEIIYESEEEKLREEKGE